MTISLPPLILKETIGAKLRRAAASATKGNLIINPVSSAAATISTPASAPSFAGMTNILPVANGWAAKFTGNTQQGSNVITNVTLVSGTPLASLKQGMFLAEFTSGILIPSYIPTGATIGSTNALASTITISTPALANSTGVTFYIPTDQIDYIGGVPTSSSGNMYLTGATALAATPSNIVVPQIFEFWTDAANVTTSTYGIALVLNVDGSLPDMYRIAIDGVYQTAAPVAFPNASGANYITIQFAAAGPHKVRLELSIAYLLLQVYVTNPATIWKGTNGADLRIGLFGDSWSNAGEVGSWGPRNTVATLGELMGWKYDFLAVGGTGYVFASTHFAWTSAYRSIGDVTRRKYDALVFLGSINDLYATDVALTAAALQTWQQARSAQPNIPFFIFGVPQSTGTNLATAQRMEADLQSAFAAWGDPNAYFIPISNDLNGPWLTASNIAWATNGYLALTTVNATLNGTTTMTVNSVTSGPPISLGLPVSGTYLTTQTITAFGTGTGGAGTYTLSAAATGSATETVTAGDGNHPSDGIGTVYLAQRMAAALSMTVLPALT